MDESGVEGGDDLAREDVARDMHGFDVWAVLGDRGVQLAGSLIASALCSSRRRVGTNVVLSSGECEKGRFRQIRISRG